MTSSENLVTRKEISVIDRQAFAITHYYLDIVDRIEDLSATSFLFKKIHFENERNTSLRFSTQSNVVLMQFCVQGKCSHRNSKSKKNITINTSEYNIIYIPKGSFSLISSSDELDLLNIYIDEKFFFAHIPENHPSFQAKKTALFGAILSKNLDINPRLKNVLNDIKCCEFEGHLKSLYLKAKMIELLALQFAQDEEEYPLGLNLQEVTKMRRIKELIENNIHESYSISYLARLAGTNEQYLKKHFKLVYNHTVFGYMLSCKMQKAKEMLLSGKYRIGEIAETVGYRHATHFTNAFKKFFGYLPKIIKTKLLLGSYFSLGVELEIFEMLIAL